MTTREVTAADERAAGPQRTRIDGIDLARFLAIIGMMTAHLWVNDSFDITQPASVLNPGAWAAVFDGRSAALFGLLAGVSVAIVSRRPLSLGGAEVPRLRLNLFARGVVIAGIGIVLEELQYAIAVVLTVYGFVFVALALVVRASPRRLLVLAAGSMLLGNASVMVAELVPTTLWEPNGIIVRVFIGGMYPLFIWVGYGLAGMAVMRMGLAEPAVQRRMVAVGAAMALGAYALGAVVSRIWTHVSLPGIEEFATGRPQPDVMDLGMVEIATPTSDWQYILLSPEAHSGGLLDLIGSLGVALAVLGACLIACRNGRVLRLTGPLRAAGAMPLTIYILHVLTAAVVAKLFFWQKAEFMELLLSTQVTDGPEHERAMELLMSWLVETTLAKWALLVASIILFPALATLWRRRHARGPAEELLSRAVAKVTAESPPVTWQR
ncbi:heparan-alpha-glucosaminide N-acetyltransferase domain-containing protein [Rhodococcus sp. IEGM 1408]|uniref:heparan-alpha-glucosaminide N-acetyltransferase domain-containing protein n=1 Tax=Rhodococcus sp. IEGM 1408 TaxID=3082220 RepID=UPI0029545631|nr:heparan-alpha-glucosaminide N-acetyltransferase domain-containing protein [Rhodococcus sp. IEGM 1408]MDV8001700.1 heparan-alpha-glucosaminide N-acetyltransferase domain-containing protein [Rhodococcus sp. IEGM 1408]